MKIANGYFSKVVSSIRLVKTQMSSRGLTRPWSYNNTMTVNMAENPSASTASRQK
jgi:hypothetical protein